MNRVVDLLYQLSNQVGAYDLNQWELSVERLERERLNSKKSQTHTATTNNPTVKREAPDDVRSGTRRLPSDTCSCVSPVPDLDETESPYSSAVPSPTRSYAPLNGDLPRCPEANLSEFIDVDLIKGSTFSKAKTNVSSWNLLQQSLKFYFLLPMYPDFWKGQISSTFYQALLVLYVGQLTCWYYFLYSFSEDEHAHLKSSHYELLLPLLFGINLSIIHCRVVSTKLTTVSQKKSPVAVVVSQIHLARKSSVIPTVSRSEDCSDLDDADLSAAVSSATEDEDSSKDDCKLSVPRINVQNKKRIFRSTSQRRHSRSQDSQGDDHFDEASSALSYSSSSSSESVNGAAPPCSDDEQFRLGGREGPVEARFSFSATSAMDPLQMVHKSTPSYTAKNAKIGCRFWQEIKEDESMASSGYGSIHVPKYSCQKLELTAYDIASRMTQTVSDRYSNYFPTSNWALFIISYATLLALLPLTFRILRLDSKPLDNTYKTAIYLMNGVAFRFLIAVVYFSMLCVALRAYYQRLLFAKLFSRITSARRAQKHKLPHFRLAKTKKYQGMANSPIIFKATGPSTVN